MPPFHVELEDSKIQFATKISARFLVDRSVQELTQSEDFFAKLHLDWKTVGVLQNLEGEAQILRNRAVIFNVEWKAFPRQVIEQPLFLRSLNPLFHDFVKQSHKWILADSRLCVTSVQTLTIVVAHSEIGSY
jgi:hypothetical protein